MPHSQPDAVRAPVFAGRFYPDEPRELSAAVTSYIEHARGASPTPKALIAPHAGYIYSGPVAGSAFAGVSALRGRIDRVLLVGPSHRVAFHGIAAPTHSHFTTPLGQMPVDREAVERLVSASSFVERFDAAHAQEHSLEVLLPFIQVALGAVSIVPLVVGRATEAQVASALELLWDDRTLPVISSDLSHFLTHREAVALDTATSRAIVALDGDAIDSAQACGQRPIRGLLNVARRRGLTATLLDQRNSGDTAGPKDSVVGYGAYVFV